MWSNLPDHKCHSGSDNVCFSTPGPVKYGLGRIHPTNEICVFPLYSQYTFRYGAMYSAFSGYEVYYPGVLLFTMSEKKSCISFTISY